MDERDGGGLWWTGPGGDLMGATVFRRRVGEYLPAGFPVRLHPATLDVVMCPPHLVRELVGITTRAIKAGEDVQYSPDGNTPDILTRVPYPGIPPVPRYTPDG